MTTVSTVRNSQILKDRLISVFIGFFAILWIFPILWTLWSSFRPYKEISRTRHLLDA